MPKLRERIAYSDFAAARAACEAIRAGREADVDERLALSALGIEFTRNWQRRSSDDDAVVMTIN